MTIVVIIAAKNTNPPKAPRAIIAPRFNFAPNGCLRSPSTLSGMFTFGASLCLTLTLLLLISFSCG